MSHLLPRRPKARLTSTDQLQRTVMIAAAALLTVSVLFGGYYYWDRYIHLGDQSPLELDIAQLEQAIRDNPQDPERRVVLAEYYLGKGSYPQALEQAEQVLASFPDHQGALLVSGIAHARANQAETALAPLEKLIALRKDLMMAATDTTLETAYYFYGESLLKLNRALDALAALEAALAITPTDADALYQAGEAAHALGQAERAVEFYHRAVRLVPDFAEAYGGMIESYTLLGRPEYVAYARGMQAFSMGDYKTAQTHLEAATQKLSDFAPAFLGLGLTYEKNGRLAEALTAINHALALKPDDFAAQQAQGRLQAALKAQGG